MEGRATSTIVYHGYSSNIKFKRNKVRIDDRPKQMEPTKAQQPNVEKSISSIKDNKGLIQSLKRKREAVKQKKESVRNNDEAEKLRSDDSPREVGAVKDHSAQVLTTVQDTLPTTTSLGRSKISKMPAASNELVSKLMKKIQDNQLFMKKLETRSEMNKVQSAEAMVKVEAKLVEALKQNQTLTEDKNRLEEQFTRISEENRFQAQQIKGYEARVRQLFEEMKQKDCHNAETARHLQTTIEQLNKNVEHQMNENKTNILEIKKLKQKEKNQTEELQQLLEELTKAKSQLQQKIENLQKIEKAKDHDISMLKAQLSDSQKKLTTLQDAPSVEGLPLDGSIRIRKKFENGLEYDASIRGWDYRNGYFAFYDDGDIGTVTKAEVEKYRMDSDQSNLDMYEGALRTEEIESFTLKWQLKATFSDQIIGLFNDMKRYRKCVDNIRKTQTHVHLNVEEKPHKLTVSRDNVVGDAFKSSFFKTAKFKGQYAALSNLEVRFTHGQGAQRVVEDGIDEMGLSSEFNTLFWEQLELYCSHDPNFEGSDDEGLVRLFCQEAPGSTILLPVKYCDNEGQPYPLTKGLRQQYEIVGRMLLRSFLRNLAAPFAFASSILLDYCLDFDLQYRSAKKSLNEMLSDLLSVDPSYSYVQTIIEDGRSTYGDLLQNGDATPLTLQNAHQCVKEFIRQRVILPRDEQLRSIKKGFSLDNSLSVAPFLEICSSAKERRLLLCGEEVFSAKGLWRVLDFQGFGKYEAKVKEYLWETLEEMNETELRLFLKFVTGLYALPMSSPNNPFRIAVKPDAQQSNGQSSQVQSRFPTAQTCYKELTLPRYESKAEMKERILEAIKPQHSHFTIN